MQIIQLNSSEEIEEELLQYDQTFIRPISTRVDSLSDYAEKLFEKAYCYKVLYKGRAVGFFAFYLNTDDKFVFLTLIAVKKEYREIGIGSEILQYIDSFCNKNACESIRLEVDRMNEKALCFYKKNGYEIYSEASKYSFYMERGV